MHGLEKKLTEKLNGNRNKNDTGDLANANEIQLKNVIGINGVRLKERANGVDLGKVDPER